MSKHLPPLRLTGARILRDGALQARSIAVEDGRITRGPLPEIDLTGYLVLPGIVDLHGSSFSRHLAPRPAAQFDPLTALAATDREAAANGVTTAYLTQGWSWQGGLRGPDFAETLLNLLSSYRSTALTDLRVALRCETHMVDTAARLIAAVRNHNVGYVSFCNTLDDTLDNLRDPDLLSSDTTKFDSAGLQSLRDRLTRAHERSREVPRHLCRLAEAFDEMGVVYGSSGDIDGETRENYAMIGAKLCEFPQSRRAAAAAKAMGDPVIMSAPSLTVPEPLRNPVSTLDLIRGKCCDALGSDYYYPSLLSAVWTLVDRHEMPLPKAWALVSERPAQIMRLPDRGRLNVGRRADLVILNESTRQVEATLSGGNLTYMAGEAGARFLGHASTYDSDKVKLLRRTHGQPAGK